MSYAKTEYHRGKIGKVTVSSTSPFIIYSTSWGLLGTYFTQDQMVGAMEGGLRVPMKPGQLAYGQLVKTATGYQWRGDKWVAVKTYEVVDDGREGE